ncbi:hypothetical protein [Sphingobacterium lumbrici]|uniref:hypothetical protein n=1 Tax=Sphingobacterium lumbrici TaxID=2559600 RepID=UPI00112668F5|nr:hypothetical protein [Sphingobacterium lumbrici]
MKFNTLFVAAVCASTLLNSCAQKTAEERQLKYTHTSLVDGDAYAFFQIVGEHVATGLVHGDQIQNDADAKAKELGAKLKDFYAQLDPELDSIATAFHVDYPIKGVPATQSTSDITLHPATGTVEEEVQHAHESVSDYVTNVQHELAILKTQFERLTRNTNKDLQKFAKKHLAAISDLYAQAGGTEDAHAHH